MNRLNIVGSPVIFFVTGLNWTWKTVLTKELLRHFNFYQTYNLGLISKTIKYFRPDLNIDSIDNFNDKDTVMSIFTELIELQIISYYQTGVNVIFEGVQIDTQALAQMSKVTWGIILTSNQKIALERWNKPETHFKRELCAEDLLDIKESMEYQENGKFLVVNNDGVLNETLKLILDHLEKLLIKQLTIRIW